MPRSTLLCAERAPCPLSADFTLQRKRGGWMAGWLDGWLDGWMAVHDDHERPLPL